MKSNRMSIAIPEVASVNRLEAWLPAGPHKDVEKIKLSEMAAPMEVPKVDPEQVVQDILISTLRRVQKKASPEVQMAAAKYLQALSAGAL